MVLVQNEAVVLAENEAMVLVVNEAMVLVDNEAMVLVENEVIVLVENEAMDLFFFSFFFIWCSPITIKPNFFRPAVRPEIFHPSETCPSQDRSRSRSAPRPIQIRRPDRTGPL